MAATAVDEARSPAPSLPDRTSARRTPYSAASQPIPQEEQNLGASKKPTWRRLCAYAFAAAVLALADPKALSWQPWNLVVGGALCLFGAFWRIWGCGHLRKNQAVITSGPYAHVRNPLYLGTLLILFGFLLAAGNKVVVYGLLPFALVVFAIYYVPKKERMESERLRKRFGAEFDTYHAAVPGYLPRLTPWAQAKQEPMSWPLVAENSEWETFSLMAGGFGVLVARYYDFIPPYFGLAR